MVGQNDLKPAGGAGAESGLKQTEYRRPSRIRFGTRRSFLWTSISSEIVPADHSSFKEAKDLTVLRLYSLSLRAQDAERHRR